MTEEKQIQQGMSKFYQRVVANLPKVPEAKPFVVRVTEQRFETKSFTEDTSRAGLELEGQAVLAPPPPGLTSVTPNVVSMAGGTTVTIRGENFFVGATVKIAGIAATGVTFVNATTLTCVTPANGFGFVNVEVTLPSGQAVSNPTLLRYTNWPDNALLEGPRVVRSDTYSGYSYAYTLTLRLGNVPFTIPVGVQVYVYLVNHGKAFVIYNQLGFQNFGDMSVDFHTGPTGTTSGVGLFTSTTGPSMRVDIQINSDPPHSNGYVDLGVAFYHGSDPPNYVAPLSPLWGDPTQQPRAFRIVFDIAGPYPPPGPTTEFFSWSGSNPNPGHFNPWGFSPDETLSHSITIRRMRSDGTINTGYTGTATLTHTPIGSPAGQLSVFHPSTVTFVAGQVTFNLGATYNYTNAQNSQGYGYFYLTAIDGSIQNSSPNCAVLNHL